LPSGAVDSLIDLITGQRGRDGIGYRGPGDGSRHGGRGGGELSKVRQQGPVRVVPDGSGGTDGGRRRGHHGVGDAGRAHGGYAQADSREDVDVVALGDGDADRTDPHRRERGAGSDERTAIGPAVQILRAGLAAAGRVGQRHDDRPFGVGDDAAHDLFGEGPARGRQSDERGRVHSLDHVGEEGWPAGFGAGHGSRRLGETALRRAEVRAVSGEQAVDVEHADPGAGALLGQAVGHHRPHDLLADSDTGRPGAQHHHGLVAQPRPGGRYPRGQRGQHYGRRALDVVVEAEQLVAVALEDRQRVRGREILPLQQHTWQFGAHGLDEPVDEIVVAGASQPTVPPAEVHGVGQEPGVVGADVQEDRQGARRVDAAQRRVQRQLADRDAHAADALVAQAQNPLPVGDDDDVDLPPGPVTQDLRDAVAVGIGDEKATRTAVDLAEALAGQPDGRGVKDRQHLLDVVRYQPVEQRLVGVLQRPQVNVPGEVGGLLLVGLVPAARLLLQRLHHGRQQAAQAQPGAFLLGERGALVGQRVIQHPDPGTLIDAHDLSRSFPIRAGGVRYSLSGKRLSRA
jgi:hypothetical protein